MAQNKVASDILRCPTVTLMDRSEAHVGHAAVSDNDSQRTRALGGARKNVSKTGTERIMHAYEKCLAPISDPTSTFLRAKMRGKCLHCLICTIFVMLETAKNEDGCSAAIPRTQKPR